MGDVLASLKTEWRANSLKDANKQFWRNVKTAQLRAKYFPKLVEAGFVEQDREGSFLRYGKYLTVTPEQFPALRQIFPQVKDTGVYSVESVEDNTVRVSLDLGVEDVLTVGYIKKLPADSRCKIVTQTYSSVVCDR